MAGVFQNIDPPSPSPPGECVPLLRGEEWKTHSLFGEGVVGSIFWKTSDTALYSTYVSTLCDNPMPESVLSPHKDCSKIPAQKSL